MTPEVFYNFLRKFRENYIKLAPAYGRETDFILNKDWSDLNYGDRALIQNAFEDSCELVAIIHK